MGDADSSARLVVRTYAPARRGIVIAASALLLLLALYLLFEIGRYRAGYDVRAAASEHSRLEDRIDALEKANRDLRVQLAALDTARIGQVREREEMGRSIGDLQAQAARQAQQLAFYQGIVGKDATAADVHIQQLQIEHGATPQQFHLKLTLTRNGKPNSADSGVLVLRTEGRKDGQDASLPLNALGDPGPNELPYSFRYFENFDREITIPPGFEPERLAVEVRSNRRGTAPVKRVFLWNAIPR